MSSPVVLLLSLLFYVSLPRLLRMMLLPAELFVIFIIVIKHGQKVRVATMTVRYDQLVRVAPRRKLVMLR
jgi:hypothetical protein